MKILRNECAEALNEICELIGTQKVVDELNCYFSSDEVSDFLESLNSDYDLGLHYWDEEEEDEEE